MTVATKTRPCAECGAAIGLKATKCKCGWVKTIAPVVGGALGSTVGSPDHFRCAWVSGTKQCRFPGSCSRDQLGKGPFYCFGHLKCFDNGDGAEGERIVDDSHAKIESGADYSAPGMIQHARAALKVRQEDPYVAVPRPAGVKLPPRAHFVGDLTAMRLPRARPVDEELAAERKAIQGE